MPLRTCLFSLAALSLSDLFGASGSLHGASPHWRGSSGPIWNYALIASVDCGPEKPPEEHFTQTFVLHSERYEQLPAGASAWVPARCFAQFCQEVVPRLQRPLVLLVAGGAGGSGDGDESFPFECGPPEVVEEALGSPMIAHVFAQNLDYDKGRFRSKVSAIPIGVNFHTMAFEQRAERALWGGGYAVEEQQQALLEAAGNASPIGMRIPRAFLDFHHGDSMRKGPLERWRQFGEDRETIFHLLARRDIADAAPRMHRFSLWNKKCDYQFSVSPPGNGLDCYRTWEDLILGQIVIVRKTGLSELYQGLPVVEVTSWEEVTPHNLQRWHRKYSPIVGAREVLEKLTSLYWINKIREMSQAVKIRFKNLSRVG